MKKEELVVALKEACTEKLADDLASSFLDIAHDLATYTLGRMSVGKFVETIVQIMQYMENGTYDANPKVDEYLRTIESRSCLLNDGLRLCLARILRSMYSLRNKRNIAHKGEVDPNMYDLRYLFASAQWALAEIIRNSNGISMEEAGLLVNQVQAPIDSLVENFSSKRIVLADVTTRGEILILLHSVYPERIASQEIYDTINRRKQNTIQKAIHKLWNEKLLEGNSEEGYILTKKGYKEAKTVIGMVMNNNSKSK